jgi:hypothetical protein
MAVSTKHPSLTAARLADWALSIDAYNGESEIKQRGEAYLPMPSGYRGHSDDGLAAYTAYKMRAQFPDVLAASVGAMLGIVHGEKIQIELPSNMEYLRENADGEGKTLEDFHKDATRVLLYLGRYGILADAPSGGGDPFLAGYRGDTITNWDTGFFVLNESEMVRNGFMWTYEEKYRVLQMADGVYTAEAHTPTGIVEATPTRLGGGTLDSIPFAIASAKDMGADLETPPLIGIARAALAMYQLSADYRLQLYMSGQETLVAINGEAPTAVGAGVVHEMQGGDGVTPDLKYVSPSCIGIDKHLSAIQDNREIAIQAGARLFEQSNQASESGKARKMRFRSETANLKTVAQASCSLMEQSLRNAARLLGQSDAVIEAITVTPPKDLLDASLTPQEAVALFSLVESGGLSHETFYERAQAGGIANAERDFAAEYALIEGRDIDADGI